MARKGQFVSSEAVLQSLSQLGSKYKDYRGKPKVIVGYTAQYAIYVHENTQAFHERGNARFLIKPLLENKDEISDVIVKGTKRTKSLEKGLKLGGLRLQRMSQKQVPVDTGNLKNSAFTRAE